MKRISLLALAIVVAMVVFGCSGGASSQQTSQQSSQSASVTQADRDAAAAYIGSKEYGDLSAYVGTVMDGVVELADSGNAAELQDRFQKLSAMIEAMDGLSVPDTCKDVDYALRQLARAEAVAIGDYSDAALAKSNGDSDAATKALAEAGEYVDLAKQFTEEFGAATNELMARFS